MLRRVTTTKLRIGMFLHAVEASWLKNPFWRSRFAITEESQIAALREAGVEMVVIDLDRGLGDISTETAPKTISAKTRNFATERAEAAAVIARSKETIQGFFDAARLGGTVQSEAVRAVVDDITGSVLAHPHTLLGMVRLKSKDEYTYMHSVAVCALMVNLARELGLAVDMMHDLGLAGLVHDIGKMMIPDVILNKPGALDDDEFAIVRTHPDRGGEMLLRALNMPQVAIDVCLHHHEKIDGTGYPDRLEGEQISLAARMGAICDVYDALTSDRSYKGAWSPAEALAAMHGWKGQFDPVVLFAFFQSIAIFPPGMLVRMRSGHLAIVLSNGRRASRPQVRLFFDIAENRLIRPRDIVLATSGSSREIVIEEAPESWHVHDWPALQEHLQREATSLDIADINRLWHGTALPQTDGLALRTPDPRDRPPEQRPH